MLLHRGTVGDVTTQQTHWVMLLHRDTVGDVIAYGDTVGDVTTWRHTG